MKKDGETGGPRLSGRELQVLSLLANGRMTDQIAHDLGISRATVEFHLRNARIKTGSQTREQAVARAVAKGDIAIVSGKAVPRP